MPNRLSTLQVNPIKQIASLVHPGGVVAVGRGSEVRWSWLAIWWL